MPAGFFAGTSLEPMEQSRAPVDERGCRRDIRSSGWTTAFSKLQASSGGFGRRNTFSSLGADPSREGGTAVSPELLPVRNLVLTCSPTPSFPAGRASRCRQDLVLRHRWQATGRRPQRSPVLQTSHSAVIIRQCVGARHHPMTDTGRAIRLFRHRRHCGAAAACCS